VIKLNFDLKATYIYARTITQGAIRSQARRIGRDPHTLTRKDAHEILEYLARSGPDTVAGQYYNHASDHELDTCLSIFKR
jgi:hypothetical protein